jgi:5-methylcytosine-specific restriction endonuclease McrA
MKLNREIIYSKFKGHCAYCGQFIQIKDMQVDHVIPQYGFESYLVNKFKIPYFLQHLTKADINHPYNLFPSCKVCNGWKSTYHIELFRSEIQDQIKRLNERHANYRMAKKYGLIQETEKPVKFYFETDLNKMK